MNPLVRQGQITMATKLDEYFINQYPFDRRDLREVKTAIQECVDLYLTVGRRASQGKSQKSWLSRRKGWSYDVSVDDSGKPNSPSSNLTASTTGMIGSALKRLLGTDSGLRASEGYRDQPFFSPTKFVDIKELTRLVDDSVFALTSLGDSWVQGEFLTESKTYGPNDPATLGWCWDLSKDNPNAQSLRIAVIRSAVKRAASFTKTHGEKSGGILIEPTEGRPGASAFMGLRFARLIQSLMMSLSQSELKKYDQKNDLDRARTVLARFFESTLHRHLSFAEIPDSRFDAAELTFCLEGMLLCERWQIDDRVFLRVIELLKRSQEANAFWRSETPIVAMKTGHVLLPVSVEAAKSLLAAVSIYDGDKKLHAPIATTCIEMLRRFWRWLVSRKIEINLGKDFDSKKVFGWHSEHVNDKKIIHLWETSQVLEFLLSFEHLLRLHIARTTLELSGVRHDWPREDEVRVIPDRNSDWVDRWNSFDPNTTEPKDRRLYHRIKRDFLDSRQGISGDKMAPFAKGSNWSMLLYGPPGTGKSTIAENLSKALNCRLITISVSDFMAAGPTQMEARAKNIFQMIEEQPFSVVLFDEFDPFMYNREKERFSKLGGDFQLMTNGMLPKLQDLRKSGSVVFIFATNFIERIDPAIRRRGRFDQFYMVPPLDWGARARALKSFLEKDFTSSVKIKKASCLFGYPDLKIACEASKQSSSSRSEYASMLLRELDNMSPSVSISSYDRRLFEIHERVKKPEFNAVLVEEFFALLCLRVEAGLPIENNSVVDDDSKSLLDRVFDELKSPDSDVAQKAVGFVLEQRGVSLGDDLSKDNVLKQMSLISNHPEGKTKPGKRKYGAQSLKREKIRRRLKGRRT